MHVIVPLHTPANGFACIRATRKESPWHACTTYVRGYLCKASGLIEPQRARSLRVYLQLYECPCYKYASRTSRYFILSVDLPTVQPPSHWGLRGLALLCSAE